MKEIEGRFWNKVDRASENECWIWNGGTVSKRHYGYFWAGHKSKNGKPVCTLAHRYSYELHKGLIPDGFTIDHLCNNSRCVNPQHLEVVTMKENIHRGNGLTAVNAQKTFCKRGHLLEFGYYKNHKNWRYCRQCAIEKQKKWRSKKLRQDGIQLSQ